MLDYLLESISHDLLTYTIRATLVYSVWLVVKALYNISLHPLAHFSGPRIAAISPWWLYCQGATRQPEEVFEKLHKQYREETIPGVKYERELTDAGSSILRIGPNELHIDDPEVYFTLYSQTTRFLKEPKFYAGFNAPGTAFTEGDPTLHKERRKLIQRNFSKATIQSSAILIQKKLKSLETAINRMGPDESINIHNALRCATVDIISEFAFGDSFDLIPNAKDADFDDTFLKAFDLVATSVLHFTFWPVLRAITNYTPESLSLKMSDQVAGFVRLNQRIQLACRRFYESDHIDRGDGDQPIIFHQLRDLTEKARAAEAIDIIVAGSDTTATTLTIGIHQILSNARIVSKLRAEVDQVMLDPVLPPQLHELERLEYLTACCKESIRFAMATPGRLPRIVPSSPPFIVADKVIPPGTIVGMSAHTMHYSEDIWGSNAREFVPERWLGHEVSHLDKYLVSFSKGARMCLGINLAYAEIRIVLSTFFSHFDMRLDPSITPEDTERMDCFTTSLRGPGPRVSFKSRQRL